MLKRPYDRLARKAGDAPDQQAKDDAPPFDSIDSPKFDEAVRRVGTRPYAETAKCMEESYQETLEYLKSKGVPTPEEFTKQLAKKRK